MRFIFVSFILLLLSGSVSAKSSNFSVERNGLNIEAELALFGVDLNELDLGTAYKKEDEKLISILLAVALGPFGGHRLYLGTKPHVPVVYTLTLGGGFGILPLIDIFHLLFAKDLSPYRNNGNIFMWRPDKSTPQ